VVSRVIKFIMARGEHVVMKFTWKSLGALCAALMVHAERLDSLLKPSWPNAEKVQEEMYAMVDTLMIHVVDQKWFSAFAMIGETEEMVTSQEFCAVSWGSLFCISAILLTKILCHHCHRQRGMHLLAASMWLIQNMSQTRWTGSGLLRLAGACCQGRTWKGLSRCVRMGFFGGGNNVIFEDWLAINRLRVGYLRI
jgi:hypothetical protein